MEVDKVEVEQKIRFDSLNLPENILKALGEMGYEYLTPIQEETFGPVRQGRDILALAETGSGKTSACGIPLMERIDPDLRAVQALILVPTRELALQYVDEIDRINKYTHIAPFAVYGGAPIDIQKTKLNHGVHVLVATPGRLIDLLYNSNLSLGHVRTVVLDEADEMLKMGFIEDVDFIMSCMLQAHQTLLFSATMPYEIERLIDRYLTDYVKIELNRNQIQPKSIRHTFMHVGFDGCLEALKRYLAEEKVTQALVFCNSRDGGERLFGRIRRGDDLVEFIHGGIEQSRRTSIYNRFKQKKIKVMVATDIASRGLDFTHVTHVINFDFPRTNEAYTHRTGRTGRMGRVGIALTFVKDMNLRAVQNLIKKLRLTPEWIGNEPDMSRAGKSSGRHQGHGGGRPHTSHQASHHDSRQHHAASAGSSGSSNSSSAGGSSNSGSANNASKRSRHRRRKSNSAGN